MRLSDIAQFLGGELEGEGDLDIKGVNTLEESQPGDITFLANPKYKAKLHTTRASAVIVNREIFTDRLALVRVDNPYLAFAKIIPLFSKIELPPPGIHPSFITGEEVQIGQNCSILPYVVVGNRVKIGDRTVLYSGVYIGNDVTIGNDVVIYPHVTIMHGVQIGNRVIIHSGAVIGSDGFGFVPQAETYQKIPQIGTVLIEDDVEIGANVTIDRATLGKTHIQRGVKIDNLVQIAHNVVIGENSIIVAQVGISGSTQVGRHVTLAGQVGLVGHIKIGDYVKIGAQSGVTKSIPSHAVVSGSPAVDHLLWKKSQVSLLKLPELIQRVRDLERRVEELERGKS
jgi:UDP-3-O-[3-hydroxymyristoyl] glucosamine N-acyltransferase